MLRIFFASLFFLFTLSIGSHSANKERRVALVIGNSAYDKTAVLANPHNDAKAVAEALAGLEFEVIEGFDLSKAAFDKKVLKFARKLKGADVGLFFYAGHGLQINGRNYLVPTDAALEDEAAIDFSMVEMNTVLKQMERQPRTNLIFLDACRDNPLAKNLSRSMGNRGGGIGRGLAQLVTPRSGTMIVFATQPGNVAKDGTGDNSPFTTALLEHINTPGVSVLTMMQRVTKSVSTVTQGKQVPWAHSSMTDPFIFKKQLRERKRDGGGSGGGSGGGGGGIDVEAIYWQTIMDKEDASLFRAYVKRYPQGHFMSLAGHLIKRYEPKKVVMSVPRKIVAKKKPLIDREHFLQCAGKAFSEPDFSNARAKESVNAFIDYWEDHKSLSDLRWLAYIMATARHETENRFYPIREGGKESDRLARFLVKYQYLTRKITQPYHKPDKKTGEVYYGRGFVSLTWADNYKKLGRAIGLGDRLYEEPDLALEPDIASKILFSGMISGAFRYSRNREPKGKQKLESFFNSTQSNWVGARNIINGDIKRNGEKIARAAKKFHACLKLVKK